MTPRTILGLSLPDSSSFIFFLLFPSPSLFPSPLVLLSNLSTRGGGRCQGTTCWSSRLPPLPTALTLFVRLRGEWFTFWESCLPKTESLEWWILSFLESHAFTLTDHVSEIAEHSGNGLPHGNAPTSQKELVGVMKIISRHLLVCNKWVFLKLNQPKIGFIFLKRKRKKEKQEQRKWVVQRLLWKCH